MLIQTKWRGDIKLKNMEKSVYIKLESLFKIYH